MQTANVTLDSNVTDLGGGRFSYAWTLTNNGTGDFFQFFQAGPGRGPNFLQPPIPLVAGGTQMDTFIGGPPVIGPWGGRWNAGVSATDPMAQDFLATPEPATLVLFGAGLLGVVAMTRKRFLQKN